jgi:hypothetical protein
MCRQNQARSQHLVRLTGVIAATISALSAFPFFVAFGYFIALDPSINKHLKFFWIALTLGLPVSIVAVLFGTLVYRSTRARGILAWGILMCLIWFFLALLSFPKS